MILSGVAIATLTGENGLFARAKQVKEQTNYVQAEEKIKLAINASYDNTANLNDELLKENLNSIDGINEKIEKITYDLEITVDGYKFKIDKEGKITSIGRNEGDNEQNPNVVLNYDFKSNSKNQDKEKLDKILDCTGNNNKTILYNIELNEKQNGIEFNGTDSYVQLDLKQDLSFPLTVETTILPEKQNSDNQIIFMEPKLRIGIQKYYSNFYVTVNYDTTGFKVPSDFYDGNLKHIVVIYKSLDYYKMYINGIELDKCSSSNSNSTNTGDIFYLGRRAGGNYFKGTIYNFRIYNKILQEDEILNSYQSDKEFIENGTNKIERNNLVLEYNIKNNFTIKNVPYIIKDSSKNQNDIIFNDAEYNEKRNGIIFNGNSTYAQLNLKQALTFPMTIETTISCTEKKNEVIYLEPESQTALGIWNNNFLLTILTQAVTIPVPSDFYDGELKHIVITYNSLTDFELYVNGEKINKSTSTDSWNISIGTVPYLGKRNGRDYFKGTMYNFKIYNVILSEDEIIKSK